MTPPAHPDPEHADAELLALLTDGDDAALDAFYDRFAAQVYSLALHLCRRESAAEQVTEDVFLAVWRRPDLLATLAGPLTGRVLAVTYRRALDASATPAREYRGGHRGYPDVGTRAAVVVGEVLVRSQTGDGSADMSSAPHSSTSTTPTLEPEDVSSEPSCSVCPHAWSAHDALGRRFCTATQDVGWQRGCICRS